MLSQTPLDFCCSEYGTSLRDSGTIPQESFSPSAGVWSRNCVDTKSRSKTRGTTFSTSEKGIAELNNDGGESIYFQV